jgi:formylglycine-generating enzyme required for sulfatase activity
MKGLKIFGVLFVSVVITALSIDASDTLSGRGGTLLAQLVGFEKSICPSGMVHVPAALTYTCVDKYEASANPSCVVGNPNNQFDTEANLAQADCWVSSESLLPWRHINREQAAVMCARSGKRLPSAAEWYQFSMGTPSDKCNVDKGNVEKPGANSECISAAGAVNAVGNAWEWVTDDVIDGVYEGRKLPEAGYVRQVDSSGVATLTTTEKENTNDYFWSDSEGTYGMIRGGFYGSRLDAGVFAVHAATAPTFSGEAIGFRCVR